MKYREALAFLGSFENRMSGFDREIIKELVDLAKPNIGKAKIIHVAGTNGKGTTATIAARALQEEGYRVGSYFSPHIYSVRERIRLNGKEISERDFAVQVEKIISLIGKMNKQPSYFELMTLIAMNYFAQKKTDFIVLETGMGGRLDATNIFTPAVGIITSISMEHSQYLGNTIEKIAAEKAGIIKEGIPIAILGDNKGIGVVKKVAKERNSRLVIPSYRVKEFSLRGSTMDITKPIEMRNVHMGIIGKHQAGNAALALAALCTLKDGGIKISEKAMRRGILKARILGRIEVMQKKPLIISDVAHNPAAIKAAMETIKLFPFERLIVVFSCFNDKDYAKMLEAINADLFVLCELDNERAAGIEELAAHCRANTIAIRSPKEAFRQALEFAGKKDLVLVTGSHYLIAEVFGKKERGKA